MNAMSNYNRINMLSIMCVFILTHFIYTDFLISKSMILIFMLLICTTNVFINRGRIVIEKSKLFIIYLGIIMFIFFCFPGARRDVKTLAFVYMVLLMGLILLTISPDKNQIFKSFKIIKIGSLLIAVYVIFCRLFPSVYLDGILPHLSEEVQIRGKKLLRYGYGVPMGASAVFADYVFALCLFILLAEYLVLKWDRKQRIYNLLLIAFLIIGMFVEGRKGEPLVALIALMIQIFNTLNITRKDHLNKLIRTIFIAVIVLLILAFTLQSIGALDRFILMSLRIKLNSSGAQLDISSGRIVLWKLAVELFENNPILGIGWGNFANFAPIINGEDIAEVHNNYLQILCETGIVGFMLIMMPIIAIYIKIIIQIRSISYSQNYDNISRILCSVSFSIQTFFLLLSFIDPSFYKGLYWAIYSIAILFYSLSKKRKW